MLTSTRALRSVIWTCAAIGAGTIGTKSASAQCTRTTAHVYVGTQGAGQEAKVFEYAGGQDWTELTPTAGWDLATVMDLAMYNGHLYAAGQTKNGFAGLDGLGQVWRYDGNRAWIKVGELDTSVMVLEVMGGQLYAGTANALDGLEGELYRCTTCDGTDWGTVLESGPIQGEAIRSGIVPSLPSLPHSCAGNRLFLGALNFDTFWTYDDTLGFDEVDSQYGSCIWDFAEYDSAYDSGRLYAGAYGVSVGPVYWSPVSFNCAEDETIDFTVAFTTDGNNWTVERFRDLLYVGSGRYVPDSEGATLYSFNGNPTSPTPSVVWTRPTTKRAEGVSALASVGDVYLLIGLGVPDGYTYVGDGRAEIYLYEGTYIRRISPDDRSGGGIFQGGVQCILVVGDATDCNGDDIPDQCQEYPDCNENGVPDWYEDDDCNGNSVLDVCEIHANPSLDGNHNGILDSCEPDCDGDGIPDSIELDNGAADCNHDGIPDECQLGDRPTNGPK